MRIETPAKFIVPALPVGDHVGTFHQHDGWSRKATFFTAAQSITTMAGKKYPAGTVFVTRTRELDLVREHESNDKERREWCRIAKVPFKEIDALIKHRRDTAEERARESELARLKDRAAQVGFELVKIDPKTRKPRKKA